MSYRLSIVEKDLAGFVSPSTDETGAMIVKSLKGKKLPIKCQTDNDALLYAGYPSAYYPSVFEAVAFAKKAPLWLVCPFGSGSFWGGVYVTANDVLAFTAGQSDPETTFSFNQVNIVASGLIEASAAPGQVDFSGSLSTVPIIEYSTQIYVSGVLINASDAASAFSGTDIDTGGTNTIDYDTGAYDFKTKSGVVASGAQVVMKYATRQDMGATISHAFFAASPCTDDLAIDIKALGGTQFRMTLYTKTGTTYSAIPDHTNIIYSLSREKDNFGRSIYIEDVFTNDPYLLYKVNTSFISSYSVDATYKDFYGGRRIQPADSDINTAWDNFRFANKYPATIFMDAIGGFATKVNSMINTYQPFAHGLTMIPMGNDASAAVTYRQNEGLDSDNTSMYTNWTRITDPYNNSSAWISNIGSIGGKYALMADVYDSGAPAGIDEDNHGGQLADWQYLEVEYDYTDAELKALDEAQINPIIKDEVYGLMVYGDKTMIAVNTDTSFIGARRAYNFLLKTVSRQVLRKQEFKNNDDYHRDKARVMTDEFIASTFGAVGAFREWYVQCDTTNNNDAILNQRKFVLDIYVKVTPTSEFVLLRLTRVSQGTVLADLIK